VFPPEPVNAIAPGPTDTNMWDQLAEASGEDPDAASRAHAERAAQLPIRRFGRPDEIASAALSSLILRTTSSLASASTLPEARTSGRGS
jgi:NAD(P)-dependent dehydrogenase (short-subunit alcohol dehydrogenase family)